MQGHALGDWVDVTVEVLHDWDAISEDHLQAGAEATTELVAHDALAGCCWEEAVADHACVERSGQSDASAAVWWAQMHCAERGLLHRRQCCSWRILCAGLPHPGLCLSGELLLRPDDCWVVVSLDAATVAAIADVG